MPAIANGLADHSRGHGRKSTSQRLPLQPTSVNGGPHMNGVFQHESETKQHTHSHSLHTHPLHDHDKSRVEHSRSRSQLPTSSLPPTNMNPVRPKGMARRISVGLPTHLKLERSNYGYQPATKPTYATSSDGRKRRTWFTASEFTTSILVLLPYTIIQATNNLDSTSRSLKPVLGGAEMHGSTPLPQHMNPCLLSACALTSGTLMIVGGTSKMRAVVRGQYGGKSDATGHKRTSSFTSMQVGPISVHRGRQLAGRLLGVGLPFYASSRLGSDRVGLVLLAALVADITIVDNEPRDLLSKAGAKRLLSSRRWTLFAMFLQLLVDFLGFSNSSSLFSNKILGYLALSISVFALPPPFPTMAAKKAYVSSPVEPPPPSGSNILTTLREIPSAAQALSPSDSQLSNLVYTPEDVDLTLIAGAALGLLTSLIYFLTIPTALAFSYFSMLGGISAICASALALTFAQPQRLRQSRGVGVAFGSLLCSTSLLFLGPISWSSYAYQASLIIVSLAGLVYDTHNSVSISSHHTHGHTNGHGHHHEEKGHSEHHAEPSRISRYLLTKSQRWPLLHSILVEKDSRRIFYFMILNFGFMLVQTFYGVATGSLGLLSDSIHMFFDCLALVVGLCAAVMSKWPPSTRFPYGFGKMDTLAGFANGIFLMLISVEIVYEAVERLAEGSEMHRLGELLTVSGLGLIVNLIGMTAFGHAHHGHGHSHGGHDHGHSHEGHDHSDDSHAGHDNSDHPHAGHDHSHNHPNHDHHDHDHLHNHLHSCPTPSPLSVPATPSKPVHSHSHAHGHSHGHHHGNENMHGIFLHIMADTLGSVAVVISTLLINYYGWVGFDPLASVLIAVLIFASAIPLVASSARTLLLTIPEDTEFDLREALAGVSALRGVVGYAVPKFWLEEGDDRRVLGVIHVIAARGADMEDVKERAVAYLKTRHMNVLVQVERDGNGRCWCRGGTTPNPLSASAFAAKAG